MTFAKFLKNNVICRVFLQTNIVLKTLLVHDYCSKHLYLCYAWEFENENGSEPDLTDYLEHGSKTVGLLFIKQCYIHKYKIIQINHHLIGKS